MKTLFRFFDITMNYIIIIVHFVFDLKSIGGDWYFNFFLS